MRHVIQSPARWSYPFKLWASDNIYERDNTASPRKSDQTEARKCANQLNYGNPSYSYDGKPAPSFYGYEGYGYGKYPWEYQVVANIKSYTMTLWYMPAGSPKQKITYVNSNGEAEPANNFNKIQSYFQSVPVPDVTKVPFGDLSSEGTDRDTVIYGVGTKQMWDMFRFDGTPGHYTFRGGGYLANASVGKGIYPTEAGGTWGPHSTSLYGLGGTIMTQDIIEVLRGGGINHALMLSLPSTIGPAQLPSVRYDEFNNISPTLEDEISPNPAYGTPHSKDAIRQADWFCFPPSSKASEFGLTSKFAVAIYEAIRKYGMFIGDSSGSCSFEIECPISIGTPYSYAQVSPWAGSSYNFSSFIPSWSADPSLPKLEETFNGPGNVFLELPWKELEQLEPFAS